MMDQVPTLAILFVLIFGVNLIPAFAPPTWMALAFVGFELPESNPLLLALISAAAATLGRLVLAKFSHWLVRGRLLSEAQRRNIDVIRERLEKRTALTFGFFLLYAFSPLPSNLLFIAYGLTGLPLSRVALPFFLGRTATYAFFAMTGAEAGRRFRFEPSESGHHAVAYFIASQLLLFGVLYLFTRVDWKALLDRHKLEWLSRSGTQPP
jgi:membrane protein YqaA with SNARE-associated domain